MLAPWKTSYDQPRQLIKKHRHHFSSSHVWIWELDPKEGWAPKNWYFGIVLEKILESPLDSKDINPVNPKGNQSWIFTGRTDAEAEAPILWPSAVKKLTHWKRPWCWERLRAGEGGDRGWWLDGITKLSWLWLWANSKRWWRTWKPCSPWGCKEQNTT